jgi:hypothetical protein
VEKVIKTGDERENKGEMKRKIISRHAFGIILSATYSRFNESNNHAHWLYMLPLFAPHAAAATRKEKTSSVFPLCHALGDTAAILRHLSLQGAQISQMIQRERESRAAFLHYAIWVIVVYSDLVKCN